MNKLFDNFYSTKLSIPTGYLEVNPLVALFFLRAARKEIIKTRKNKNRTINRDHKEFISGIRYGFSCALSTIKRLEDIIQQEIASSTET